jgi:hypothetical protein
MTGTWKSLFGVCLLLTAAGFGVTQGSVSGRVQDTFGKPQMGAVIEVYSTAPMPVSRAYTDAKGEYTLRELLPGTYFIKASADQFLPSVREGIVVKGGAHVLVNLTLTTLIEAFQLLPSRKADVKSDDDWRWTLRSSANRPILRVLEDSGLAVVSNEQRDGGLKARLAFIAGSDGTALGASDVTTAFNVEHSFFNSGTMSFSGNLAQGEGAPTGVLRASYKHHFASGADPEFAITMHRFATQDLLTHQASVGALSLRMADSTALTSFLEADYGTEIQTVQFRGRATAFKPFAALTGHIGDNMTVQYRYTTSRPNTRAELGFDSIYTELTQSDPRLSVSGGDVRLERAAHHEVAVSRRIGKNNFQIAAYRDALSDPSLLGAGDIVFSSSDLSSANFLPDLSTSTFNYTGKGYSTSGVRAVAQHKWENGLTATVDYSFGGALVSVNPGAFPEFDSRALHSATAKLSGNVKATGTRWLTSYKWTSDKNAVTPVDLFNDSAGRSDPFLNLFVRQSIPTGSFIPAKMEAVVDVRNLLAQGYVPFLSPDGQTLYLVQSPRSLRGGVAFSF